MNCKIFYSWQSDSPNKTNRGFIEDVLNKVVKEISKDESIKIEPVIDRDTQGLAGSPDIKNAIFNKIDNADIFLADVSIINSSSNEKRKMPNPNVLIELGYALKALGDERLILVMNSTYGDVTLLPFDLKTRRTIQYQVSENTPDKTLQKKQLKGNLVNAIKLILKEIEGKDKYQEQNNLFYELNEAIENNKPKQLLLVDDFFVNFVEKLQQLSPDFSIFNNQPLRYSNEVTEPIIDSLNNSQDLIIKFTNICKNIAINDNQQCAEIVYQKFSLIANLYNRNKDFSGVSYEFSFDYFRIIGKRLFIIFFSCLMKKNRWETIKKILNENIYVENPLFSRTLEAENVPFGYLCNFLLYKGWDFVEKESHYQQQLKKSFNDTQLSKIVTFKDYQGTDLFLFFKSQADQRENYWYADSIRGMNEAPKYLIDAKNKTGAQNLCFVLGLKDISELKQFLEQEIKNVRNMHQSLFPFFPIGNFNIDSIDSK